MNLVIKKKIDSVLSEAWEKRHETIDIQNVSEAIRLSRENNYDLGIAKGNLCLATYTWRSNVEHEKLLMLLEEALDIFISNNDIDGQIKTYNAFGLINYKNGNALKEIEYYLKCYELARDYNHPMLPVCCNNIGNVYFNIGKYDSAIEYLKYAEEYKDIEENIRSLLLSNLADCFIKVNNLDEAEKYALKAVEVGNFSKRYTGIALLRLGCVYNKKNKFQDALKNLKNALTLFIELKDTTVIVECYMEIGKAYENLGMKSEEIEAYNNAINLAESMSIIKSLYGMHERLYRIFEKDKDYEKALQHYKSYVKYEKLMNAGEVQAKIEEHKTKLQLETFEDINAMSEIGREITASMDLNVVLEKVCGHMKKLMDIDVLGIGTYNDETRIIDYKMFIENGEKLSGYKTTVDDSRSHAAESIRNNELMMWNLKSDEDDQSVYFGNEDSTKVQSVIYSPLFVNGKIIGVMTVQSYNLNAYQERHLRLIKTLTSYIAIALNNSQKSEQLIQTAEELKQALKHIQDTQSQLILSEKMAALGQLVAGVTHEINNPFGAIQASIDNIQTYLKNTVFNKLPELAKKLTKDEYTKLFSVLQNISPVQNITPEEMRRRKKELKCKLDAGEIENSRKIANILVEVNLYDKYNELDLLLNHPHNEEIFRTIHEISDIIMNSNNIKIAVERVSKIIFALKSYSHFDNSGIAVMSKLEEGIETVLELYRYNMKYGVKVKKEYRLDAEILCYPDELNQVWTNVITNSLQAMEYKGSLQIETYEEDNYAVVKITDSGCGIPDEIKPKIFNPFFTTKKQGEGTGLGLEIVKRIIDKHNGKIEVESVPGNTSFYMKLPMNNI